MKICVFGLENITIGKHNVRDSRLDQIDKLAKSKKKTYVQIEVVSEGSVMDADAVIANADAKTDLVLKDLDFVDNRLAKEITEQEKAVLTKLKTGLEKENFVSGMDLSEDEKKAISGYALLTSRPIVLAQKDDEQDLNALLARMLAESGYISFFTAGEKESRAWLIKKGTTAWEAAGAIHSDIQRGFIRAEIISFSDFIQQGGETPAKQAGKLRLEQKNYIVQDGDWVLFRFNK